MDHSAEDVSEELEGGAAFVAAIDSEKRQAGFGELLGDGEVVETEFVQPLFVFEDGEMAVKAGDLVKVPGVEEEEGV